MKTLAPAMNECCNRQFQLTEEDILLGDGKRVGFHQRILELGDVLVFHALAVQWIEPNPTAHLRFPVTHARSDVIGMLLEGCDQLPCRTVVHALTGQPLTIAILPYVARDIAHSVSRIKQQREIVDQILHGIPRIGRRKSVEAVVAVIFDGVVPCHRSLSARSPTALFRNLHNRATLDGSGRAAKARPLLFAFAGMVTRISLTPIIPNGAGKALLLECHAYGNPCGAVNLRNVDVLQSRQDILVHEKSRPFTVYIRTASSPGERANDSSPSGRSEHWRCRTAMCLRAESRNAPNSGSAWVWRVLPPAAVSDGR